MRHERDVMVSCELTMPFGKHKDEKIESIDTSYLVWVVENLDELDAGLYDAIEEELIDRGADLS